MKYYQDRTQNIIDDFVKTMKKEDKLEKQKTWLKKQKYRKTLTRKNGK